MSDVSVLTKNIHGLNVWYVKVPFSLNTHVGFFSLSGSYAENEENQGVAHYLEHLFFKGTKNRDLFDISDDAALLGAQQNAYTSEYATHYFLNVPKINTEGAIELLCDMMFNPLFPEKEIEKERTVIQEERKMYEDNPQYFFYEETEGAFFDFQTGHRIIGTKETIDSLSRQDFLDYHHTMYGIDNTLLVIVGDMEPEEVFSMCSRYLNYNPFGANDTVSVKKDIVYGDYRNHHFLRPNIQQTYLLGFFQAPGMDDDDRAKMVCMLNALGGGMYSLLFKEIREKLGLCYSVWSFDYLHNAYSSACALYCQTDPSKASLAKNKMIEIVSDVKENGFTEKSFECAKAAQLGSFCRETSSVSQLAKIIGTCAIHSVKLDFDETYQDILDLTLESVNEYAKKTLPGPDDVYWSQMDPAGE